MRKPPQSQPDDAVLIRRYRKGHAAAFETLVRRYERPLYTFLVRSTGDRDLAQDLFQETFLRVLKALPRYREQGQFKSWLYRIAGTVAIDAGRQATVRRRQFVLDDQIVAEAPDSGEGADVLVERADQVSRIEGALALLPEKQRRVFLLRHHADLRFREIAELTGDPLNTVLSRMRYAVATIRQALNIERA